LFAALSQERRRLQNEPIQQPQHNALALV
jgi:hypothetical protein